MLSACSTAVIYGRQNFAGIRRGDLANARELRSADGSYVATELALNLITLYARILQTTPSTARIQAVSYSDFRPMSVLYPRYHGRLPVSARYLPNVRMTQSTTPLHPSDLHAGQIVKLYGYKPPDSTTVDVFMLEVVR
jgi:hypothetical protein